MNAYTGQIMMEAKMFTGRKQVMSLEKEMHRIGFVAMLLGTGFLSLWAIACAVSGFMASGGPMSFVKTWFSAVIGV